MSQRIPVVFAFAAALLAQTPGTPAPAFEVATIKPASLPGPAQVAAGKLHIGMNVDGARVDIGAMSLTDLIRTAYRVKSYQVSGPSWMNTTRFDVMAKIPDGAPKDQVPEMLQALLAERFGLKIHRESQEHSVYALVVAKGGPKLQESPPDDPPPNQPSPDQPPGDQAENRSAATVNTEKGPVRVTNDGKGILVRGSASGNMRITPVDGKMQMQASKISMESLAEMLSRFVDRPVVDATGLKGNFQVTLELSMEDLRNVARAQGIMVPGGDAARPPDAASDPSGGTIFQTIERLGLKLEAKKAPLDTIFVDHIEKSPTEN
jgi:uncharacterized protein (TIGR03435 family)